MCRTRTHSSFSWLTWLCPLAEDVGPDCDLVSNPHLPHDGGLGALRLGLGLGGGLLRGGEVLNSEEFVSIKPGEWESRECWEREWMFIFIPRRPNCCLRHCLQLVNLLLQFKVTHVIWRYKGSAKRIFCEWLFVSSGYIFLLHYSDRQMYLVHVIPIRLEEKKSSW